MRPRNRHASNVASLAVALAAALQVGCSEEKPESPGAVVSVEAARPESAAPADAATAAATPAETGKKLFKQHGCHQCHSADGKNGVGPTVKGQFGTERKLVDGSTVVMDAAYIRATLEDPKRAIVAGYAPMMPPYKGKLTEPEIAAIVAYVESLR